MSMMDVMNQAAQPPQQGAAPAAGAQPPSGPQPGQSGSPMQPQEMMRMGEGSPEELQDLFDKIMTLISSEIWEGNGADQVAEQLNQDESQPAEVIGKFTGFYLLMATSAARSKGGMLPPIVVVGAAGETASQLTDLALMFKMVSPDMADDTADAAALIGIEVLMQNGGQQMSPEEQQEYAEITKAVIDASPNAQQIAEESAEDAIEDAAEMQGMESDAEAYGGNDAENEQAQQGGGMAAAMGGA